MIRQWGWVLIGAAAVTTLNAAEPVIVRPGTTATGDEIVVAGKRFATGTPIVLWTDPPRYDAYSLVPRFAPADSQPADRKRPRYDSRARRVGAAAEIQERIAKQGWDLPTLQSIVDQFVIHYDVCGTSKRCFQVLQDDRHLSVHFMLDLDGTIYQTLDLQEAAWHATKANGRSVGIEIANMGAYGPDEKSPLAKWYVKDANGQVRITIADALGKDSQRDQNLILRPIRNEPVLGTIQGQKLEQYDLTPQQYAALGKLTAALCRALPKIQCDYPRGADGKLLTGALSDEAYKSYQGVLGHYHVQTNKTDPGPAFQWDRVIGDARKALAH